jgi:hypothetical protein
MEIPEKNVARQMRINLELQKKKEEEEKFNKWINNRFECFKTKFIDSINIIYNNNNNLFKICVGIDVNDKPYMNDIPQTVETLQKQIDEYLISKDYHKFSKKNETRRETIGKSRVTFEIKTLIYTIYLE